MPCPMTDTVPAERGHGDGSTGERVAGSPLRSVQRAGEPGCGGDGGGRTATRAKRDGLRDPWRRGPLEVLARRFDLTFASAPTRRRRTPTGNDYVVVAGDERHGRRARRRPDDHGDGDGRGRRGAGRTGCADGVVSLGDECDGELRPRTPVRRSGTTTHQVKSPQGVDGGDDDDDHGAQRDDHAARTRSTTCRCGRRTPRAHGWSGSGSGSTDANASPSFTSPETFNARENQTAVGTVEASDSDTGDSVTGYVIQGGADRLEVLYRRRELAP